MIPLKGNFIPTTQNFDVQALYEADTSSAKFKELIVRLAQYVNQISANVNSKASGALSTQEVNTGATFPSSATVIPVQGKAITPRSIFSVLVKFGTLPNSTTKSVAHGIAFDANSTLVRIYGGATNAAGTSLLPLPYASPVLNENISVYCDATNIYVKTGIDRTSYTKCNLIIEYLKN